MLENIFFDTYEIYNKSTDKWVRFQWCMTTSTGYVIHTPPGANNFFKVDADGWWHGELIKNCPENKEHALLYNQLSVRKVQEAFFKKDE